MSDQPIDANSSDQIIVTVEQADALLEMIASDENAWRISSAALTSGLVSLGLAGANGLAGDAARILEPVRAAHSRIIIRVVSPSMRGIVRDWRIWPTAPRSVLCVPTWTACTSVRLMTAKSPTSQPSPPCCTPDRPSTTGLLTFPRISSLRFVPWMRKALKMCSTIS